MKTWLTAAELAGVPGMPGHRTGVTRWGDAGRITRRRRTGGKGWEYLASSLPAETQEALRTRALARAVAAPGQVPAPSDEQAPALPASVAGDDLDQDPVALRDWQRDAAEARVALLEVADEWMQERGLRARAVYGQLAQAAAAETLPPQLLELVGRANARGAGGARVTVATLYRWAKARSEARAHGHDPVAALAPAQTRPHKPLPAWLAGVLTEYRKPSKPTMAAAYRAYRDSLRTPAELRALPPLRTVQHHIHAMPAEVREYGRMGARAIRSIQPFVRRTTDGLWPMDVVTVDGHAAKCYVQRPDSHRRVRPEITTYLDICTRRVVGYSVWWAESQYAIWLALRSMILEPKHGMNAVANGIPAMQYSDRGAYRGDEHRSVLARLGVVPMFSLPYRAQARGAIERLNSSLWLPLARSQPTYCGDGADQEHFKQALKAADTEGTHILEWGEWLRACDQAIAEYNERPHASLRHGRTKLSPNQAWERALQEGWAPTPLAHDDLHDLLPAVMRGATPARQVRRGEVTTPWGRYAHEALRPWHGRDVRVHYDPADGSRVWICQADGRFICCAERDANARPYVPQSQIDYARDKREQARVGRLERRIEVAQAEETPVLEGQTYDLPDLVLQTNPLGELVDADRGREAAPTASVAELPTPDADAYLDRLDSLDSDPARYDTWRILRDRDAAGDLLSPREAQFLESFGRSRYCQAMEEIRADFDARTTGAAAPEGGRP